MVILVSAVLSSHQVPCALYAGCCFVVLLVVVRFEEEVVAQGASCHTYLLYIDSVVYQKYIYFPLKDLKR